MLLSNVCEICNHLTTLKGRKQKQSATQHLMNLSLCDLIYLYLLTLSPPKIVSKKSSEESFILTDKFVVRQGRHNQFKADNLLHLTLCLATTLINRDDDFLLLFY